MGGAETIATSLPVAYACPYACACSGVRRPLFAISERSVLRLLFDETTVHYSFLTNLSRFLSFSFSDCPVLCVGTDDINDLHRMGECMPRALCRSMESRRGRGILDKWPFAKEIADARPSFLFRLRAFLRVPLTASSNLVSPRCTAVFFVYLAREPRCVLNARSRAYRIS